MLNKVCKNHIKYGKLSLNEFTKMCIRDNILSYLLKKVFRLNEYFSKDWRAVLIVTKISYKNAL